MLPQTMKAQDDASFFRNFHEKDNNPYLSWDIKPENLLDAIMATAPDGADIVLKDGTWVIPADFEYCAHLAGNAFPDLDPLRGCAALASTDQGRTWVRRGAVPPTKEDTHACEHSIVERPDGRLHMFLRTFGGLKESESADGGRTWSAPKLPDAIRQPVARFAYIRLASGKLLVVKNGFTPMEIVTRTDKAGKPIDPWWTARSRLTAFVSDDEGKTWKGGLRIDPRVRVAYPDAFQAPDGSIYVTYDHDRNTKKDELLFAKFTEADVLAGKLVTAGSSLRNVIFSEGGRPGSVSGKQEEGKGNEVK